MLSKVLYIDSFFPMNNFIPSFVFFFFSLSHNGKNIIQFMSKSLFLLYTRSIHKYMQRNMNKGPATRDIHWKMYTIHHTYFCELLYISFRLFHWFELRGGVEPQETKPWLVLQPISIQIKGIIWQNKKQYVKQSVVYYVYPTTHEM